MTPQLVVGCKAAIRDASVRRRQHIRDGEVRCAEVKARLAAFEEIAGERGKERVIEQRGAEKAGRSGGNLFSAKGLEEASIITEVEPPSMQLLQVSKSGP